MGLQFTYPGVLYGLFLILIPIIIHLFSFRKFQHVYFHNIHLLQDTKSEQNRTKTKLKEVLILLSRILFITFLVLAFAQPYIPTNINSNDAENKNVVVYIDNSFSAQGESNEGIIIDVAKQKAQKIIEAYPEATPFHIVTNNFSEQDNIPLTKSQITQIISEIEICPDSKKLSEVTSRISSLTPDVSSDIYIISDFQSKTADIENIKTDSIHSIKLLPIESKINNNISLDSVWFESPYRKVKQTESLYVKISNSGNKEYVNQPIKLFINDSLRSISNFSIQANQSIVIKLDYTVNAPGMIQGKITVDDYPILFDNTYFFSYVINENINVLDIYEKQPQTSIQKLLEIDKYIRTTPIKESEIDYSTIQNYDAIILNELSQISSGLSFQIEQFVSSGKTVIVIPSNKIDLDNYNEFIRYFSNQTIEMFDTSRKKINTIDLKNKITQNLFEKLPQNVSYPLVSGYYVVIPNQNNVILTFENNYPFLLEFTKLNGNVFMFTSPLSSSAKTFTTHPLIMCLYNMVLFIKNTGNIQSTIGKNIHINSSEVESQIPIQIINEQSNVDFIPQYTNHSSFNEILIKPNRNLQQAGIYKLNQNSKTVTKFALNFNRDESDMSYKTPDEIQNEIQKFTLSNCKVITETIDSVLHSIQNNEIGNHLWRITLLLSLLFIIAEIALIKFLK